MKSLCSTHHHTWLIQTDCNWLTPGLDLVPGRRCHCGNAVIVPRPPGTHSSIPYWVDAITSQAAAAMIAHHPELKTW